MDSKEVLAEANTVLDMVKSLVLSEFEFPWEHNLDLANKCNDAIGLLIEVAQGMVTSVISELPEEEEEEEDDDDL